MVDPGVEEEVVDVARVVQQHPDRDPAVDAERRQQGRDALVQPQLALVDELQDDGRRHGLGDRGEGEARVGRHRPRVRHVGIARDAPPHPTVVPEHRDRHAGDEVLGAPGVEPPLQGVCVGRRRSCPRRRTARAPWWPKASASADAGSPWVQVSGGRWAWRWRSPPRARSDRSASRRRARRGRPSPWARTVAAAAMVDGSRPVPPSSPIPATRAARTSTVAAPRRTGVTAVR